MTFFQLPRTTVSSGTHGGTDAHLINSSFISYAASLPRTRFVQYENISAYTSESVEELHRREVIKQFRLPADICVLPFRPVEPVADTVFYTTSLYSKSDLQLLHLLCATFESVYVYKPELLNVMFERYVVCKGFRSTPYAVRLLSLPPPYTFPLSQYFLTRVEEINAIFGQQELETIHAETKDNSKCIEWVSKYL